MAEQTVTAGSKVLRPLPVSGDRGLVSFPLCGKEPAGRTGAWATPAAALWSRPVRQIVPPVTRHARSRAVLNPDSQHLNPGSDRTGSNAAPVAALGVTPFAEPPLLSSPGRLRCAGRPKRLWQRVRQGAHRHPPTAPPSTGEGDLWGDLSAVGQVTGSLFRAARISPSPTPSRGKGPCPPPARPWAGARESEREDQL